MHSTPANPPAHSTHAVTELIHHAYTPPEGFASPAVPVAKGSTITTTPARALLSYWSMAARYA